MENNLFEKIKRKVNDTVLVNTSYNTNYSAANRAREEFVIDYNDKIGNRKYSVFVDTMSLGEIENELIILKNMIGSGMSTVSIVKLIDCINGLKNSNSDVLDVLFYQNSFSNYDKEIDKKQYYEGIFYREFLLKIIKCLNLIPKEDKILKKFK